MNTNATILVVDDEEVVRHSYQRVLASVRCEVEAVDSGEQALKAMELNLTTSFSWICGCPAWMAWPC